MGMVPKGIVTGAAGLLPEGAEVLDLACGEGQALVWLAGRGLRCTGVDVSAIGLGKAQALAESRGVEVSWVQADLDQWDPDERQWDVVLCIHFLSRDLIPRIRRAVRPGGLVLIEVLAEGAEVDPRFTAAPNELLRWFVDWRVLTYEELPGDRPVASLVARKPGGP
jgi:tellurite methyltransferase